MKTLTNCNCCACNCCYSPHQVNNFKVRLQGVANFNCGTCSLWNRTWELTLSEKTENRCFWVKTDGLPCRGTLLYLEILCPDLRFPVPNTYVEIGIYENGLFMGEWHVLFGGSLRIDCTDLLLDTWTVSATLPNPNQCDFTGGTARMFQ